ncbi:MAG TPA: hypothetical protein VFX44_00715 [Solirubrobacterales bacterium]|nr:hypothetical protein [Solirubrobacterales bacterium]
MSPAESADSLQKFAETHGLAYAERVDLPQQGSTLSHSDGKVEGAATGKLPGGIEGSLVHFTYTYTWTDSDDHTHTETRRFTLAVTQVPESIGFLPYMGFAGSASRLNPMAGSTEMTKIDLGKDRGFDGAHACAYKGTSQSWLTQLLSPALLDWLARSEDDWGFELADGVLCAGRDGYLTAAGDLETVCEDAARIAGAVRQESVEEAEGGEGQLDAAKDPDAADPAMERALAKVKTDPPAYLTAALPAYRSYSRGSTETFLRALRYALLLTLVLNVPGAAIPIVLIVQGAYALLIGIEAALFLIIFFFAFRSRVRSTSQKYAEEDFFRAYAEARNLKLEEPLHFSASHAEAKLPFKPDRVMSGPLPGGGEGALVLCGDGSKRSDRIAVVLGPKGPVAEAGLESESPGLSTKDLDTFCEQLAGEAREDKATAPTA